DAPDEQVAQCCDARQGVSNCMLASGQLQLLNSIANGFEVIQFHLRVFAGDENAVGSAAECGSNRIARAVGRAFAVVLFRGNVDIDTGPEKSLGSFQAGASALGFAIDVVGREAGVGNFIEPTLRVVQNAI